MSGKTTDNPKENFHIENGFGSHLKCVEKKQKESEIISKNCTGNSAQQLKNQSDDFNKLKRDLKKPKDNIPLSVDIPKTPAVFANFKNESDSGNMPVILNVFTLSQVSPASHTKLRTTNIIRENNFPVTPPCSPPLSMLEQLTAAQNISFPNKVKISPPMDNDLTKVIVNGPGELNVNGIYCPVEHNRQSVNNGALPVFPAQINSFMNQENYAAQDQTKRPYGVNYGSQSPFIMTEAKEKNNIICSGRKLAPKGRFVPQLFPGRSSEEVHGLSGEYVSPNQCVFSESLKDVRRNHFAIYDASNNKNVVLNNNDQPGLSCLSGSAENCAIVCDGLDPFVRGHKTHLHRSAVTVTSGNTSYSTVQSFGDHNECAVNDSHAFLSPRDVKVLQLKKRIREQEAALKKLRTNHS